jgi:TrmH family RNA methyltransferase
VADPSILSRFTVVLWRPKSPGNVGSVARAMKNMGFARLRVADPMSYEDPLFFQAESERMAWDAVDVLAAREEHPTIEAAVGDAILVAGTTSAPPDGFSVLAPRALAFRLIGEARRGPVALLLGQEDIGLTRDAMALCQVLGSIPSSSAYASLNLAQAALIFLYEIRLAAMELSRGGSGDPEPFPAAPAPDASRERDDPSGGASPPTQTEVEGFYERLTRTLDEIGYFEGSGRAHMVRELRRIFNRALLTRREVRILEGILHRINWIRSRRPGEP